jgi:hypothetical protein
MKAQAGGIQYTIRGVPREVDRILRTKATRRGQSLNQVIVDELIAVTVGSQRRPDFSDFVGRWTHDPAFDEIVAAQRHVDSDKWK